MYKKGVILTRGGDILENLDEIVTEDIIKIINEEKKEKDIGILKKWVIISMKIESL